VADPQSPQVMTRGPIHEAFAAPVIHDPVAGPIIPKAPPDPIQELPPDQKPAGQNVQWIPGYWSWDVSQNDYLWISGIWREPPPSSQWVPGYWHAVEGGSQWVPGTWVPVSTGQDQAQGDQSYLPAPPKSLENGPTSPQPAPNTAWTPGYWSWQGGGYAWRPGFWAAVQANWIWMPAHYVWTPSGYLFVAGYWDLPIANRGLMFAPVYYPQPVYAQPGFFFSPTISIVGSAVTANLFVQASTNQYLFGNFYAQNFASVGIAPWFSFTIATGRPLYYDPLFSYYAVINVRQNPAWVTQVREQYALRRDRVELRPPSTYIEQTRIIERNITINRNVTVADHRTMAMPLSKLAADPVAGRGLRLERVSAAEQHQLRQHIAEVHQFREQRLQQEREGAKARADGGAAMTRPRPIKLPRSPIAARPVAHPAGSHTAVAHPAGSHTAVARRPEEGHPGARPEGAQRLDRRGEATRTTNPARPGGETPARQRARGAGGAVPGRPAQEGAGARAPSRGLTPRTGAHEPSRSSPTSRERPRARSNEEEERQGPRQ
jgi:hypothetical protein